MSSLEPVAVRYHPETHTATLRLTRRRTETDLILSGGLIRESRTSHIRSLDSHIS